MAYTYAMNVPEHLLKTFGERVRHRRLELSISQEDLAEYAGIHRTHVSKIELGKSDVSLRVAYQIAKALQTSLNSLIVEEP